MIETLKRNDIPFDEGNYQLIEYQDVYSISDNKKVKVKDIGKKVALTNTFFFDYLRENALKFSTYKEYPFRIKILNSADKRNSKIFGIKEGTELTLPVFEFHYGNCKESLIGESHLIAFDLCNSEDMKLIIRICSKINAVLKSFFERRNEILAEISCHFGIHEEKVLLVGDFSPPSLKILPKDDSIKWTNPYKLSTASEVRKYTEHLFNIASIK